MWPGRHGRATLSGAVIVPAGGGPGPRVGIGFGLDAKSPVPRSIVDVGTFGDGNYFQTNTVSLRHGEQQTFEVIAKTKLHYCEFQLLLTVLDDGQTLTQTVDNGGRPVRVTRTAAATRAGHISEAPALRV